MAGSDFLGIDPGKNGGIALVDWDGSCLEILPMPETERETADIFSRAKAEVRFALIERLQPMPGVMRGVTGAFKIGQSYGFLRGLLIACGIPFGEVTPQKWQKALGCLTRGDKAVSRARAQQLYPGIRVTNKTADALLIARYCQMQHTP